MDAAEKTRLSKEAEMQMEAIRRINTWKNIALTLSAIGVAVTYHGMAGGRNLFVGILGIILIVLGALCAIVLNLGIKNGRRNVEKIINLLDKGVEAS